MYNNEKPTRKNLYTSFLSKQLMCIFLKVKKKSLNNEDINKTNMLLLDDGHCLRDHALKACSIENKQKIEI